MREQLPVIGTVAHDQDPQGHRSPLQRSPRMISPTLVNVGPVCSRSPEASRKVPESARASDARGSQPASRPRAHGTRIDQCTSIVRDAIDPVGAGRKQPAIVALPCLERHRRRKRQVLVAPSPARLRRQGHRGLSAVDHHGLSRQPSERCRKFLAEHACVASESRPPDPRAQAVVPRRRCSRETGHPQARHDLHRHPRHVPDRRPPRIGPSDQFCDLGRQRRERHGAEFARRMQQAGADRARIIARHVRDHQGTRSASARERCQATAFQLRQPSARGVHSRRSGAPEPSAQRLSLCRSSSSMPGTGHSTRLDAPPETRNSNGASGGNART